MADELTVEWEDANLQQFLPGEITSLADILPPFQAFLEAVGLAKQTSVALSQKFPPPTFTPDPLLVGIQATLDTLRELTEDLINTGVSVLFVPVTTGGLRAHSRFIRANLLNSRDPRRPDFSDDAYVAGFGMLGFGIDNLAVDQIKRSFEGAFLTDENTQRIADKVRLERVGKFFDPFKKNKIAGTAKPIPDSPWVTLRASDFIPKAGEVLNKVQSFLASLQSHIDSEQITKYIKFIDQTLTQVAETITAVDDVLNFINESFPDLPLKFYSFRAQSGGTDAVANSIASWMNPALQPELEDVPGDAYTTGVFVMWGAPTFEEVQATYEFWQGFMFP